MSDSFYPTSGIVGARIGKLDTTAEFALGTRINGSAGTVWVYAKAGEEIAANRYVCIDTLGDAYLGTKTRIDRGETVAFNTAPSELTTGTSTPTAQTVPINNYTWFLIAGSVAAGTAANSVVRVSTRNSAAKNVAVYTSATSGVVGTASSGQTKIEGVVLLTNSTASMQSVAAIVTFPRSGAI